MNIREFQRDLNNGMSIADACSKHKVTFKRAFEILQYKDINKRKYRNIKGGYTGETYIRYDPKSRTYMLRKTVNKKFTYFGRYKTLRDAMNVRDYLMVNGWSKTNLNKVRKELNV